LWRWQGLSTTQSDWARDAVSRNRKRLSATLCVAPLAILGVTRMDKL
jgi:hypothetical protein